MLKKFLLVFQQEIFKLAFKSTPTRTFQSDESETASERYYAVSRNDSLELQTAPRPTKFAPEVLWRPILTTPSKLSILTRVSGSNANQF